MYVDFDKLSDQARVWVYQANRLLTDHDVKTIDELLKPALDQWEAHGKPLLASAKISDNRFVIIGVDESYTLPSGCSIDDSTRTVRSIGDQIGVDFFDRSAIIELPNGSAKALVLPDIKNAVASGLLTPDTIVFNTLVQTKASYLTNWRIRATESWLGRYFKKIAV